MNPRGTCAPIRFRVGRLQPGSATPPACVIGCLSIPKTHRELPRPHPSSVDQVRRGSSGTCPPRPPTSGRVGPHTADGPLRRAESSRTSLRIARLLANRPTAAPEYSPTSAGGEGAVRGAATLERSLLPAWGLAPGWRRVGHRAPAELRRGDDSQDAPLRIQDRDRRDGCSSSNTG